MSNTINPDMAGDLNTPAVPALQGLTPPDPVVIEPEEKHYYCSVPNASFIKKDGTRLGFVNGFFSSCIKAIKDYLDSEIESGQVSAYLRSATTDEVARIMSVRNPMAALEADFKENKEPELRKQLEKEIVASMMGVPVSEVTDDIADGFMKRTANAPLGKTDDPEEIKRRLGLIGNSKADEFIPIESKPSPIASGMVGSDKIAGAAAASDMTNPGALRGGLDNLVSRGQG